MNKGHPVSRDAFAVLTQTNLAIHQFFADFRHDNEEMVPQVGFEPTTRCLEARNPKPCLLAALRHEYGIQRPANRHKAGSRIQVHSDACLPDYIG